jgi:hypothetical protein
MNGSRTLVAMTLLVAAHGVAVRPAAAQGAALAQECPEAQQLCGRAAYAATVVQPRVPLVLAGGNPVPGTASTLGLRLGKPRISVSARTTLTRVEVPDVRTEGATGGTAFTAAGYNADLGVGVFGGVPVLPTVGGFGSLDVLASVGLAGLPGGAGFEGTAGSWAAGARVGILRESFTLPGVATSVMYRRTGRVAWGDPELVTTAAHYSLQDLSTISARATVGKRFLAVGLTGGAGWDRTRSTARVRARGDVEGEIVEAVLRGATATRTQLHASAAWTTLVLHFVGEAGYQRGAGAPADAPAGVARISGRGGFFAGLAMRIAI